MTKVDRGAARLIINPTAGQKVGITTNTQGLTEVAAALERYEVPFQVTPTARPGHARELAAEAVERGDDLILVAGGDGTVGEAAQALVGSPTTLGIVPLGSVMNVGRMLGLPRDVDGAVRAIVANNRRRIDVGKVKNHYFLEGAGVGINAAVFKYLDRLDSGNWNSLRALLRFVIRFRPRRFRVTVDDEYREFRGYMVGVANGPAVGLLNLAPEASLSDAAFNVSLFSDVGKFRFFVDCLRLARGNAVDVKAGKLKGGIVEVDASRPMPVHADNDVVGVTPVRFECVPKALSVIIGDDKAAST